MSKPINLRQARKARARAEKAAQADANAARHGLSRAEREIEAARAKALRDKLDGHRRE
jgi:hypothetical protein